MRLQGKLEIDHNAAPDSLSTFLSGVQRSRQFTGGPTRREVQEVGSLGNYSGPLASTFLSELLFSDLIILTFCGWNLLSSSSLPFPLTFVACPPVVPSLQGRLAQSWLKPERSFEFVPEFEADSLPKRLHRWTKLSGLVFLYIDTVCWPRNRGGESVTNRGLT